MKWLDKKGVLSFNKKEYAYGDDLPEDINKDLLARLKKNGQVGDIFEKIEPGKAHKDTMDENTRLKSLIETLEVEKNILTEKVDVMEKDAGDFAALEKEVAKLKKKAGA
jgi:hypothetical protein